MIFYTADCHFGHENIIKLCGRPFSDAKEMDEMLIEKWNSKVTNEDSVVIVGDMFYKHPAPIDVLKRLKGNKVLIPGNHDFGWHFHGCSNGICQYDDYISYNCSQANSFNDSRFGFVTVCHYPWLEWPHSGRSYMIHGHLHNRTDYDFWPFIKQKVSLLNAGVDINGFEPVSIEELIENNNKFKAAQ